MLNAPSMANFFNFLLHRSTKRASRKSLSRGCWGRQISSSKADMIVARPGADMRKVGNRRHYFLVCRHPASIRMIRSHSLEASDEVAPRLSLSIGGPEDFLIWQRLSSRGSSRGHSCSFRATRAIPHPWNDSWWNDSWWGCFFLS